VRFIGLKQQEVASQTGVTTVVPPSWKYLLVATSFALILQHTDIYIDLPRAHNSTAIITDQECVAVNSALIYERCLANVRQFFFLRLATKNSKNNPFLSFICVCDFDNVKATETIVMHFDVAEFCFVNFHRRDQCLLQPDKNNGRFLRKPPRVFARIWSRTDSMFGKVKSLE
jgi:hypothetical protein